MSERLADDQSSASGFVVDGNEGVTEGFTQLTCVSKSPTHVITRAKRHGRWYALKSLAPDVADQRAYQEMLAKEFDISMRLQHPGVVLAVTIEDVPTLGRCIVMEWINGVDMKRWLAKSPSRKEKQRALNQLLDAVTYLHDMGIVHRDLKPANIMITANGHNVKLIDFSLADTDDYAILKQPAGTTGYISPEQSSVAKPDVRNDIYSLGIIMRQMDLGRRYSHIAANCLLPIDYRYSSVGELKAAIKPRLSFLQWMWVGVGMAIIIAAMVSLFKMDLSDRGALTEAPGLFREDTVLQMDRANGSVASELDTKMGAEEQPSDVIRNPLPDIAPTGKSKNDDSIPPFLAKYANDPVWNAQSDGATEVYFVLSRYLQSHKPDTLSDMMYLELDYEEMKKVGHDEIERYINTICHKFNEKELAEIRKFMSDDCDAYVNHINHWVQSRRNFVGYGK